MRICLLSEKFPPDMGGLAQTVARHARALAQAGHTVHVCVPTVGLLPDSLRTFDDDGITVHHIGMQKQWRDTLAAWSEQLVGLDREFDFDIFHGYLLAYDGFVATYLARYCGKKSVVSAHSSDLDRCAFDAARAPFVFQALAWADVVTAVSQDVVHKVRALSDRRDVPVVHNSVDVDLFNPQAIDDSLPESLGLDENTVVGFVGEAAAEKGLSTLLRAFARVAAQIPAHLIFVGGIRTQDQPVMDLYQEKYPYLSIRQIPYQPHQTLPSYYNLMDLLLIPSQRDGLPNTLLEAMACARTVIASSVGGIREVISHGEDGWLISPRDQDALVESILVLSADVETRKRIGAAARHKICMEYASSIELASNLAIYAQLVEQ